MNMLHLVCLCMYSLVIYYMTEAFQPLQVKINFNFTEKEMVVSESLEYDSKMYFMFLNGIQEYEYIIQVDMDIH